MKKNKTLKILMFLFGIFLLNTNFVSAHENDNNIESKEIIEAENQNFEETLEIEILINEYDQEYIENVVLEDGTRVGDYNYIIKEPTISLFPRLISTSSYTALGNYFHYAAWITKSDGLIALSLDPKSNVRNINSEKEAAWSVILHPNYGFAGTSNWKNTQIMKWQYDCHFWFAAFKDYWNLEPSRSADSYLFGVVLKACNP